MLRLMFERFTEQARQVIIFAQEESRTFGHNYIGGEHLLIGLIREDEGVAARVLKGLEITVERVRSDVLRRVPEGNESRSGQIPFTPSAKSILERSLREAQSLGDERIETQHLLLSLTREKNGVPARVLDDLGVDAKTILEEVLRARPETPGGQRHVEVDERIQVGLTPRARRIWMSAAARALDTGRTAVWPGDLLEALISDDTIGSVLSSTGVDVSALRERLRAMAWTEPDTPEAD